MPWRKWFSHEGLIFLCLAATILAIAVSFWLYTRVLDTASHKFYTEGHPLNELCVAYEVNDEYVVVRMWVWKPTYAPSKTTCVWGNRPIGIGASNRD